MSSAIHRYKSYFIDQAYSQRKTPAQYDSFFSHLEKIWSSTEDKSTRVQLITSLSTYMRKRGLRETEISWSLQALKDSTSARDYQKQLVLLSNIGVALSAKGRWRSAQHFLSLALHLARHFSPKLQIATILCNLAENFENLGQFENARAFIEEALEITEHESDVELANILICAYSIYLHLGEPEKALSSLFRVVNHDSIDEQSRMQGVNSYALLNYKLGEYHQAQEEFRKVLEFLLMEDDQPNIANCYQNIAMVEAAEENYEVSNLNFEKALEIYRRLDYTQEVATVLNNMGCSYRNQREFTKAHTYLSESLKLRLEIEHNSELIQTYLNISQIYCNQEAWEPALEYGKRADTYLNEFEESSILNVFVWKQLGVIHFKLKNWNKALKFFKLALNHPFFDTNKTRWGILSNIGVTYTYLEEWEKAQDYLETAIELCELEEEFDALGYANLMLNLASVEYQMEYFNEAIDSYFSASTYFAEIDEIELSAFCLKCIGIIYFEVGDFESTLLAIKEAITLVKNEFPSLRITLHEILNDVHSRLK